MVASSSSVGMVVVIGAGWSVFWCGCWCKRQRLLGALKRQRPLFSPTMSGAEQVANLALHVGYNLRTQTVVKHRDKSKKCPSRTSPLNSQRRTIVLALRKL